jgi:hypothetical protein
MFETNSTPSQWIRWSERLIFTNDGRDPSSASIATGNFNFDSMSLSWFERWQRRFFQSRGAQFCQERVPLKCHWR